MRLLWLSETPMTGPEVHDKHELYRFARRERPELRGMLPGVSPQDWTRTPS